MSSVDCKIFRNYYQGLAQTAEKNAQNKAKAIVEINRTFEVLSSLGTKNPKHLDLNGRIVRIEELTPRELKMFSEFAKKFLHKTEIPEKQANILIGHLISVEEMIENVFHEDKEKKLIHDCLKNLRIAKHQILLHEKIDRAPLVRNDNIELDAKNYLNFFLRTEQTKALTLEKKIKEERLMENIFPWTARGVFALGVSLWLVAFPIFIIIGGALALPFMFLGALLAMGAGPHMGFPVNRLSVSLENDFNNSLEELERLENYKNVVEEPEFIAFAQDPDNRYHSLRTRREDLAKLISLYQSQKKYELNRPVAEKRIREIEQQMQGQSIEQQSSGLSAIDLEVTSLTHELKQINSLRRELNLDPLSI